MLKSIRRELTIRLLVGTSLLLVAASIVLCVVVRRRLLEEFDHSLEVKARALATLTKREGHRIEIDFEIDHMPEFEEEENPEFFRILFQDGSLIHESEFMEDMESELPILGREDKAFGNVAIDDEDQGRFVQMRLKPIAEEVDPEEEEEEEEAEDEIIFMIPQSINAENATVIITVVRNREDFDRMLGFIYLTIGGIDLLVLAAIFLVVKSSIQNGLKPIDEINAQIAEIAPEALDERIAIDAPPSELATIILALNGLLDRMDKVITRERRFTSDVAHELRTPVSELRSACEVGMMSPEDTESTRLFFEDINDIALQMEKVVSNLLSLSRWDQEKAPITNEEIELDPLIKSCWGHCTQEAEAKNIVLDCRISPGISLVTDREKFEMIVQNLLDNAVAYSVPGSRIRCRLESGNPSVNLHFENMAANLCKEDLEHLFDRFWRKEVARSEVHHSGLGLSIVKTLADMLEIGIQPELLEDSWFRISLRVWI